ncbi:MAG TPA: FmdB family zinc ribbon protein [Mycobacterium sp.]|nr:FmdB family zinc ribbon protein [Mycobacterium sp.]
MPTYSYQCTECGDRFDAVQAFSDDALTTCEHCSGRLRKLFGSVGVVFKGSGFYRTDSRDAAKASINGADGSGKNGSSGGAGDKSGSAEKAATNGKSGSEKASASASSGDKSTSKAGSAASASTSS